MNTQTIWSRIAAALVAVFTLSVPVSLATTQTGCTQPVVPTNAISAAEVAVQTAQTVVSSAQAVWPIVYAAIPAAQQAAAQDAFNKAVFTANHAILAVNDAIQAAIAANNPNPDFSGIISTLGDAVNQIVAIVGSFQSAAPADRLRVASSGVDPIADMRAAAAKLAPKVR